MKRNIFIAALLLLSVTAQAQMIGATNSQRVTRQNNNNYGFSKGSHLRFAAGYPILGSVAYMYKFSPYFSFGGGAGIDFPGEEYSRRYYEEYSGLDYYDYYYMYDVGEIGGCIFAETEVSFPLSKQPDWGVFINAKFALNIIGSYDYTQYYSDFSPYSYRSHPYTAILTLGTNYQNFRFGVGMSTAYWFGGFFSYDIHL